MGNSGRLLMATLMMISVTVAFADASGNGNIPVIIGFKNKPTQADKDMIRGHGGDIKYSYNIINAVAARLPENALEAVKKNPNVAYVEADGVSGYWSGLTSSFNFGVTDASGQVVFKSSPVKNAAGTFTFTVGSVAKDGWAYDGSETSDSITV